MHTTLLELKEEPILRPITLEFLDPNGHSQILHADAEMRELNSDELEDLPVGPEPVVFSTDDSTE
jgi:C4-type Zn-finger protein